MGGQIPQWLIPQWYDKLYNLPEVTDKEMNSFVPRNACSKLA